MTEPSWKPRFRAPRATVTRVLQSPSFADSREAAVAIAEDAAALTRLAAVVETMDHTDMPLSAIADRVAAAVDFLRSRAERLDAGTHPPAPDAATAARERLVVAALHYLVTPVDLVPDFRVGGFIDDVLLLSWVFGVTAHELDPYLDDDLTPGNG